MNRQIEEKLKLNGNSITEIKIKNVNGCKYSSYRHLIEAICSNISDTNPLRKLVFGNVPPFFGSLASKCHSLKVLSLQFFRNKTNVHEHRLIVFFMDLMAE